MTKRQPNGQFGLGNKEGNRFTSTKRPDPKKVSEGRRRQIAEDNTIKAIVPKDAPKTVKKRIIKDLDKVEYPKEFVTPFIETVFDRATVEIFRGCIKNFS